MSSEKITAERRCPDCGAKIKPGTRQCWMCHADTAIRAGTPQQDAEDRALLGRIKLPEPQSEFGVMAVFGILAVLICLGLVIAAPGILVVLFVIATPALIRTVIVSRKEAQGAPATVAGLAGIFFSTLSLIIMVGLASLVAFFATCFVVCLGGMALEGGGREGPDSPGLILVASVGAGLVPGGFVAYLLFRRFWPRRS